MRGVGSGKNRTRWLVAGGMLAAGAVASQAQYVGRVDTAKAEKSQTLRATAVLEYTGDYTKPIASRLIPLAVWDGTTFQPAAFYLAQPIPLAVETGTQYQLEEGGLAKGLYDVKAAANIGGPGGAWIAVGGYQKPVSPSQSKLKASKKMPIIDGWGDDDNQPHFAHRPAPTTDSGSNSKSSGSSTSSSSSSSDPDRPTLHRRTDDSTSGGTSTTGGTTSGTGTSSTSTSTSGTGTASSSGSSSGSSSASDPDRPTLHRKTEDSGSSTTSTSGNSGSTSTPTTTPGGTGQVDPDRPTMHRRTTASSDGSPVTATADIDPNRPHLRHGRPDEQVKLDVPSDVEIAKLSGHPENLEQMVAVSDVATHSSENWRYSWADPADEKSMQAQLESMAQNLFAGKPMVAPIGGGPGSFGSGPPAKSTTAATMAKSTAASNTTTKSSTTGGTTSGTTSGTTATRTTAAHNAHRKAVLPPALPTLADEHFHAYALSFGGGATLVFTAKTTMLDGKVKYVTLIAQPDFSGKAHVLFHQMTDDDQLDQSPRMLVVDALDADGDGKAELVFELAGKTDRQYAIYRVENGEAEQVFSTAGAS